MKLPTNVKSKLNELSKAIKSLGCPYKLYVEGSYAAGRASRYSDVDLCLVVPKKYYKKIAPQLGGVLKSLRKNAMTCDYGEEKKYPGYYYCYAIYHDLGTYKIFDACLMATGTTSYRGKRELFSSGS